MGVPFFATIGILTILLIVISVAIWVVCAVLISTATAKMARSKNYDPEPWRYASLVVGLILGFVFGAIPLLILALLPPNRDSQF